MRLKQLRLYFVILLAITSNTRIKAEVAYANGHKWNVLVFADNTCNLGPISGESYSGHIDFPSEVVVPVCIGTENGEDVYENRMLRVVCFITFQNHTEIESITIPNSVTRIGDLAFSGCSNLKSVTIPNSVRDIGFDAFYNCTSLKSISIPNSVRELGNSAFYGCSNLEQVNLGNGFQIIRKFTFYECNNLKSISIPSSVTSIESYAFYKCFSLKSILIPNSVTSIGSYAFGYCNGIEQVTIGSEVKVLEQGAFYDCSSIKTISMPNSVETIEKYSFAGCSLLESVTIPNSVTSIGESAFAWCSNLQTVSIPNKVTKIEKNLFSHCGNLNSVDIPNSVTSIEEGAFYGCISLKSVSIPDKVKNIGERAFRSCKELESIIISNSVTAIGEEAFWSCENLRSVSISNKMMTIEKRSFSSCDRLESVFIPNSVTTIKEEAFSFCKSLKSLLIPNSVITMEKSAFEFCKDLRKVTILSAVKKIDDYVFIGVGDRDNPCKLFYTSNWTLNPISKILDCDLWYNGLFSWDDKSESISPISKNTYLDYSNLLNQNVDFDGKAINNIYYSLKKDGKNGYDTENGCLLMNTPMEDFIITETAGDIAFSADESTNGVALNHFVPYAYSGIIVYLGGGETCGIDTYSEDNKSCGSLGLDFQTNGNQQLCVKVGEDEPIFLTSAERTTVDVPFKLKNDTYVLIYASQDKTISANNHVAANGIKLYGINIVIDKTIDNGIRTICDSEEPHGDTLYSIDGHKINSPTHGINILRMSDGKTKKIIVK